MPLPPDYSTFTRMKRLLNVPGFFFGNYFYGICAVGLAVEGSLQQLYPLNPFYFYVGLFCATVWFYTIAYITGPDVKGANPRTNWYSTHYRFVQYSQRFLFMVMAIISVYVLATYYTAITAITIWQWLLLLIVPFSGLLYYGINNRWLGGVSLRKIGWLKPFIIGFTWAGIANVYPAVFYDITHGQPTPVTFAGVLLFIKNLMYVTVLAIMFDIKDYANDSNRKLKTFVVDHGLRNTIFYILLPLSLLGLACYVLYGTMLQFSVFRIIINTIPFILLILVAYSMKKRRPILYYLALIDGLMLIKALCGIFAMFYFS